MQGMYSMRSPAVKRLMKEAQELREPTEQFHAQPLEDNLFEWHFTIRGPADSEFDGGLYHGRIVLPPEYPMKPPSIIILTPNGRFEINKKICLSISGHHPESWQPSWSIRTAMLAIIGFMPTHGAGALGSLDYTPEERKVLARRSRDFRCSECGSISDVLKPVTEASEKTRQEIKELASQIDFKDEKEKNEALKAAKEATDATQGTTENCNPAESQQQGAYSQQQPPNPFGAAFGQFPYRMPFMPPFPSQQDQNQQNSMGSTNLSQVPRFPLPFVSPFLPPPPHMMQSGNGPFIPGMVPPWLPTMGMGTRPPFVPPNSGENVTINSTETNNLQTSVSSSENDETNMTSSSAADTRNEGGSQEETWQTTQESPEPAATDHGDESPLRSRTTGVRRRLAASMRPEEREDTQRSSTHTTRTVPSPVRPRQSDGPVFVIFISLLILAILLLVLRRLYMMKLLPVLF